MDAHETRLCAGGPRAGKVYSERNSVNEVGGRTNERYVNGNFDKPEGRCGL